MVRCSYNSCISFVALLLIQKTLNPQNKLSKDRTNYDLPLFKMFFCIYSEHDVNIKTQTEPQKSELNAHVIFDQI